MPTWDLSPERGSDEEGRVVEERREDERVSHGARPAHLIITVIKWVRTSSEEEGRVVEERRGAALEPREVLQRHQAALLTEPEPEPAERRNPREAG